MKRGPKRKVIKGFGLIAYNQNGGRIFPRLILECGHTVSRRVRRRNTGGYYHDRGYNAPRPITDDPAPGWVYCERCAKTS